MTSKIENEVKMDDVELLLHQSRCTVIVEGKALPVKGLPISKKRNRENPIEIENKSNI